MVRWAALVALALFEITMVDGERRRVFHTSDIRYQGMNRINIILNCSLFATLRSSGEFIWTIQLHNTSHFRLASTIENPDSYPDG